MKIFAEKGKVGENNECRKERVIFADLSLLTSRLWRNILRYFMVMTSENTDSYILTIQLKVETVVLAN